MKKSLMLAALSLMICSGVALADDMSGSLMPSASGMANKNAMAPAAAQGDAMKMGAMNKGDAMKKGITDESLSTQKDIADTASGTVTNTMAPANAMMSK